jgi:hypothetical protein
LLFSMVQIRSHGRDKFFKSDFWILVRYRIRFYVSKSFRIRFHPGLPGQVSDCRIMVRFMFIGSPMKSGLLFKEYKVQVFTRIIGCSLLDQFQDTVRYKISLKGYGSFGLFRVCYCNVSGSGFGFGFICIGLL